MQQSITVAWDEAVPDLMIYSFIGQWAWVQYLEAFQTELALVKAANPVRYDVIADGRASGRLPFSGGYHVKTTFEQSPAAMGAVVLVTQNGLMRAFVEACGRLYPTLKQSMLVVPTMELAREHILADRQQTMPSRM